MENRAISGQEWLDRNSHRAYPLVEDSSVLLSTGGLFPRNLISDILVVVSSSYHPVVISSVFFTRTTVTVTISYVGEELFPVGYATAVLGVSVPGIGIPITASGGGYCGSVTFGEILDTPEEVGFVNLLGPHDLGSSALLETRCCIFAGEPIVSTIVARYGGGVISGLVELEASTEIDLTLSSAEVGGDIETTIQIGLKSPEDFLPRCFPKSSDEACRCTGVIRSINGVIGDEADGNIVILIQSAGFNSPPSITSDPESYSISLELAIPGNEVCIADPAIPDEFGRLAPSVSSDCPPRKSYSGLIWAGPNCDNPPPEVPLN
jgi:hypothetical protein